jgi:hypothetical protein
MQQKSLQGKQCESVKTVPIAIGKERERETVLKRLSS